MTKRVLPIGTDNRDMSETWLTLPDGTVVDVDPVELFKNALENCYSEGISHQSGTQFLVTVLDGYLDICHQALKNDMDVDDVLDVQHEMSLARDLMNLFK